MRTLLLLPAAALLASCTRSMEIGELRTIETKERTITVTGSSETTLTPDDITLSITLGDYYKEQYTRTYYDWTQLKSFVSIAEVEKELKELLAKQGVPQNNIRVEGVNSTWQHRWWWWYDQYKAPLVYKTYLVKLNNLAAVDSIIRKLHIKGITNAHITSMRNSKEQEMRRTVKSDALKAAQEKAKYMLEAVGKELGDIVTIEEVNNDQDRLKYAHDRQDRRHPYGWYDYWWGWGYGNQGYDNNNNFNNTMSNMSSNSSVSSNGGGAGGAGGAGGGSADQPAAPRDIKLRYEVEATFTIKSNEK